MDFASNVRLLTYLRERGRILLLSNILLQKENLLESAKQSNELLRRVES